MSWNPVNEVKKWLGRAKKEIEGAAQHAEGDLKGVVKKGLNEVESAVKKGTGEVESVAKRGVQELEDAARKGTHEIEDAASKAEHEVEEAVEACLKELASAVAHGALDKLVDVVQVAAPDEIVLKIGPVSFDVADVKDRIDTLQDWAKKPPSSRGELRHMIETIAPTSVTIEISVQVALVLVSTDSLEVGWSGTWETASFLDKFEDVLGRI